MSPPVKLTYEQCLKFLGAEELADTKELRAAFLAGAFFKLVDGSEWRAWSTYHSDTPGLSVPVHRLIRCVEWRSLIQNISEGNAFVLLPNLGVDLLDFLNCNQQLGGSFRVKLVLELLKVFRRTFKNWSVNDIKPENVVLDPNTLKPSLIDLSGWLPKNALNPSCAQLPPRAFTPIYCHPTAPDDRDKNNHFAVLLMALMILNPSFMTSFWLDEVVERTPEEQVQKPNWNPTNLARYLRLINNNKATVPELPTPTNPADALFVTVFNLLFRDGTVDDLMHALGGDLVPCKKRLDFTNVRVQPN